MERKLLSQMMISSQYIQSTKTQTASYMYFTPRKKFLDERESFYNIFLHLEKDNRHNRMSQHRYKQTDA
jgi:hypothetical protein